MFIGILSDVTTFHLVLENDHTQSAQIIFWLYIPQTVC